MHTHFLKALIPCLPSTFATPLSFYLWSSVCVYVCVCVCLLILSAHSPDLPSPHVLHATSASLQLLCIFCICDSLSFCMWAHFPPLSLFVPLLFTFKRTLTHTHTLTQTNAQTLSRSQDGRGLFGSPWQPSCMPGWYQTVLWIPKRLCQGQRWRGCGGG